VSNQQERKQEATIRTIHLPEHKKDASNCGALLGTTNQPIIRGYRKLLYEKTLKEMKVMTYSRRK
jgi:hypothetical protein